MYRKITSRRAAGLGALNQKSGQAAIGAAVSIVPVISAAVSSSATVASATGLAPLLTAIGVSGPAAPFVAGAIALALPVFKLIKSLSAGCGESCLVTSKWADQSEEALKDVNRQYFGQTVRTKASQEYALQVIAELFKQLRGLCSNPATGAAGQRCISERLVRGGTAPWCPRPGHTGCDWYALYYDPIATDTGVVDDASSGGGFLGSGAGGGSTSLLLPIGLASAALLLAFGGDN